MFAAVFVTPSMTTHGIADPDRRVASRRCPAPCSARWTIRTIAGTTASGVDGWGVATAAAAPTRLPVVDVDDRRP